MDVVLSLSPEDCKALERARTIVQGLASATEAVAKSEDPVRAQCLAQALLAVRAWGSVLEDVLFVGGEVSGVLVKASAVAPARDVRILKAEERYVLGVVLEPLKEAGQTDTQKDTYSEEEVRKAAYFYMETFHNVGLQHQEFVNGKVRIRENWVTREDCTIEGQFVRKGTWLLGVHVVDDEIWRQVKDGERTGFSIGGLATRKPVAAEVQ